ncbi:hypothetical protein RHSIM_Rhsim06G0134600 [Rhododendron simsii]|uniref:Uncharacterized protein n=1 Tax=Rhododendron simsii TaxID=118357 RepID=A0A834GVD5_RHOSS|nr:hypothetical protein RHSIM_Rhsim06G0134600 [Rhododendron simsii]
MGFVYGELTKAKEEIKAAYKQVETNYRPILDVIDGKAKGRLESALHLTAYFLNPFYFFNNSTIQDDPIIMDGVLPCVEAFFPDDVNIHTKKGNRLDEIRMNSLVYVQFNAKLINNNRKGKDVLRTKESTNAQGWLVEGGDEEVDPVSGLTWEVIGEATMKSFNPEGLLEMLEYENYMRKILCRRMIPKRK